MDHPKHTEIHDLVYQLSQEVEGLDSYLSDSYEYPGGASSETVEECLDSVQQRLDALREVLPR